MLYRDALLWNLNIHIYNTYSILYITCLQDSLENYVKTMHVTNIISRIEHRSWNKFNT